MAIEFRHIGDGWAKTREQELLQERVWAAEEELRSALAKLQERSDALTQTQQGTRAAAWIYESDRRRTRWFDGASEIFGRPMTEFSGSNSHMRLVAIDDHAKINRAAAHTMRTGKPFQIEFRVKWPNGEMHWIEARGVPVKNNSRIWHGVAVDITDRKHAEMALVRSEKLAAMGRISSTIAHEVTNPLETVTNLLYLARLAEHDGLPVRTYLDQADEQLARLSNITRLTLKFVRSTAQGPVSIAQVADSVLALFRAKLASKGITVERGYVEEVQVDIVADELRQIFTNLISNAADALEGNDCRLRVQVLREADKAVVLVEDNGFGIAPEHLERVWEAFFTTKEEAGTGIGLWLTRELVEKNHGAIAVRSGDLGDGMHTSFRIEFPALV